MKQFKLIPTIKQFNQVNEFCESYNIGSDDLLIISEHTYDDYLKDLNLDTNIIYLRKYGQGEPSDVMVEAIYNDVKDIDYKRVIAIGGGTILDVAKLFCLKDMVPINDLFDHKLPFVKNKDLILIPTTCGTGSEVTNISILELTKKNTKKGLAVDELFADEAILITELLEGLPFKFFATSSIDAFIHAIESYLSPKASPLSEMFSIKAMELIIKGYKVIAAEGEEARIPLLEDFLLASTYAGIAFGNAGCAAVHALSYPLGASFHVPHGEANYAILNGVMSEYHSIDPHGKLIDLSNFLAQLLDCHPKDALLELELLLNTIIAKKPLKEYGVTEEGLAEFTDSVMENQGRLMANNYVELSREAVYSIYKSLY